MTGVMISWQSELKMSHMLVLKWNKEDQLYFNSAGVGNCTGVDQRRRLIYLLWFVDSSGKYKLMKKDWLN